MESQWKYSHIGVVFKDMVGAIEYYQSLGIFSLDPEVAKTRTHDELVHGRPVHHETKHGKRIKLGPLTLEMLQPVSGKSLHQEFLNSRGEGMQHIAFAVDDLDKERARLAEKGISIALIGMEGKGVTYFDIGQVGKLCIELVPNRGEEGRTPAAMTGGWLFHHLGIVVQNLDKALEYYQSLGIFSFDAGTSPSTLDTEALVHDKPTPLTIKIKQIQLGPLAIELIQPIEGESPHMEYLNRRGEGAHHLAFTVDDLEKEQAGLAEKGIPIVLANKDGHIAYFDIGRIGNVSLELMQRR